MSTSTNGHEVARADSSPDTGAIRAYLTGLQDRIVDRLQAIDGGVFRTDAWQRALFARDR